MITSFQPAIHFTDPTAVQLPVSTPGGFVPVWVDEETVDRLAGRRISRGSHGYPAIWHEGSMTPLHRFVMECTVGDGWLVDHVNGDRFDCRKANLRLVTHQENAANRKCTSSTGYRGVVFHQGRFVAYGKVNGRSFYLGRFADPAEAGRVANEWRIKNLPGFVLRDTSVPARLSVAA